MIDIAIIIVYSIKLWFKWVEHFDYYQNNTDNFSLSYWTVILIASMVIEMSVSYHTNNASNGVAIS